MNEQKLEWSITTTTLVVGSRFEESGLEGKRLILAVTLGGGSRIEIRITEDQFRHLLRRMKPSNHHREEFTEADGLELRRWILRKYIKVRAQKFVETKRLEVTFIDVEGGPDFS